MVKKVLVRGEKKLYWEKGDVHSKEGMIKETDIALAKSQVLTHLGKPFAVYDANFLDQTKNIRRGPQTLVAKDLSYILFHADLTKDTVVVDAGTGNGLLAAVLARYAKKVVSYDTNKDNLRLAKRNLEALGISNVELREGDMYEKIDEKNIDCLTLDLPEPWRVDLGCVKSSGTIIVYLPTITQVIEFCRTTKEHVDKVVELIEREWIVDGKRVRPTSDILGHTGFMIIVRKL